MNVTEIETDLCVLLRMARTYLAGAVSLTIEQTGVVITVTSDEAARRITEPHGMKRAVDSSFVRVWTGKVSDVPVLVRIKDQQALPVQDRRAS